mmetsp:Transcript_9431/g.21966  ORF Transcript_9431/g.21966 Transcript_9431/m.21966 type:complete len:163 (-) Transcript_9431:8-496(-)
MGATAAASLASSRSDTPRNDGTSCDATKADWMRTTAPMQRSWSFMFVENCFRNFHGNCFMATKMDATPPHRSPHSFQKDFQKILTKIGMAIGIQRCRPCSSGSVWPACMHSEIVFSHGISDFDCIGWWAIGIQRCRPCRSGSGAACTPRLSSDSDFDRVLLC